MLEGTQRCPKFRPSVEATVLPDLRCEAITVAELASAS
jgi:hypothetical protein